MAKRFIANKEIAGEFGCKSVGKGWKSREMCADREGEQKMEKEEGAALALSQKHVSLGWTPHQSKPMHTLAVPSSKMAQPCAGSIAGAPFLRSLAFPLIFPT